LFSDISMTATAAATTETTMITPPLSPSLSSDERVVRFDNECVLIPEPAKKPKLVTKSYSLPLWRKKGPHASPVSDAELDVNEDAHLVFKVPVPSFMSKSRSPTRDHAQPLSPCLVHRQSTSTSTSPTRPTPARRTSLTMSPRTDVVTIPLRSCCNNCVHITEESLREGIEWREKFSRSARRRRSTSLDSSGFSAICESPEAGSKFSAKLAINVDEVDKRRKSQELEENHERESSASSSSSDLKDFLGEGSFPSKQVTQVTPIVEEDDDDQLFPLPSPRRSPTSSPGPSPAASLSCLRASISRDSLPISVRGSTSSCEDSDSYVGKGRCTKGLLTPDTSPSIPVHVPQGLQKFPSSPSPPPLPANFTSTRHAREAFPSAESSASRSGKPRKPSASPDHKRHRSAFSLSTPTQLLKVGADALKGVGALGGSGSAPLRI
jgi:hypothetical protein